MLIFENRLIEYKRPITTMLKLTKSRTSTLLVIFLISFSSFAYACDSEDVKYRELSIDSSRYVTKPDTSQRAKPSLFGKNKESKLFCSNSTGTKCNHNSSWSSAEQFAKYLVGYRSVHCYLESRTIQFKSGVRTDSARFTVYYLDE